MEAGKFFNLNEMLKKIYRYLFIFIFRTHTVILIDANNKVDFYEQTMASTDPNGEWTSTHFQTEF